MGANHPLASLKLMIEAGATRIGCKAGPKIIGLGEKPRHLQMNQQLFLHKMWTI